MDAMKSNPRLMWLCAAVLALLVVLVVASVFEAWVLLAAIPCAVMMGAMIWMMLSMGRGGHGSA